MKLKLKFQVNQPKSKTFEYLIGNSIESLPLQQPRKIDILRLYFGFPKNISEIQKVASIVKSIQNHYRSNAIRVKGTEMIRIKIKRLVNSCKNLLSKRTICRKSHSERQKQEKFHHMIYGSFDVAESSDRQTIDPPSDSSDSILSLDSDSQSSSDVCHIDLDPDFGRDDSNDSDPDDSDPDYNPDCVSSHDKMPIAASLLTEISDSRGSYRLSENLLNVGVRINGGNPNMYGISKSNLWSKIIQLRASQKNELLSSLAAGTCKIVLQFDGKSCTKLNERHVGTEERLIILCHTEMGDIPLGFFIVESKSGRNCANQILKSLAEYNLSNRVVGLVCDTESSNTGILNGTCALLEKDLNQLLFHLMCRHHVKEIQLRDVFFEVFGRAQGANIDTFDVLIENWGNIKNARFAYSSINYEKIMENPLLQRLCEETIDLIGQHAQSKKIRDDYSEVNDLVLKFLGVRNGVPFKVVGATNNARWMARILYAFKTYLFREELNLHEDFIDSIERFCLFVSLIYLKHWNRCSNAVDAPHNDLQLLKELEEYMEIDREIATVALAAHDRHLWYLSDELVVLGLFSDKVPIEVKLDMANKIVQHSEDRTENSIRHTAQIPDIKNIQLDHFISARSFFLFERMQLNADFLNEHPEDWIESNSFKAAKQAITRLIIVVNDGAERAIQLGANTITNQRVQTETRLQEFIISSYGKNHSIL